MMRLRYVVVDELHTLRGIFGSHVAHVLRRLRRVCEHYGANPTFCFASATIGNPGELASELCGLPVEQIDDDGSPRSERVLACWQRPLLDEHSGARGVGQRRDRGAALAVRARRSPDARVHAQPARRRARRAARARAPRDSRARARRSRSPRTAPATSPSERRELELELTSGRLLGVAATNALELGIDVGGLDAVVLNGFPGTLASMWQQAGPRRAHRSPRRRPCSSPATTSSTSGTSRIPTELTGRAPERAVVNPQNPFVLRAQVACAAHELPLSPDDERWFGDGLDDAVRELVQADLLTPRGGRMYWSGRRVAGGRRRAAHRIVGRVPARRRRRRAHDRHRRRRARVRGRAPGRGVPAPGPAVPRRPARPAGPRRGARAVRRRRVHACRAPRPTSRSSPTSSTRRSASAVVHLGAVEVRSHVVAYQRKQISTNRVIEVCDLDLPERALVTRACWYTVPAEVDRSAPASRPAGCSAPCTRPSTA